MAEEVDHAAEARRRQYVDRVKRSPNREDVRKDAADWLDQCSRWVDGRGIQLDLGANTSFRDRAFVWADATADATVYGDRDFFRNLKLGQELPRGVKPEQADKLMRVLKMVGQESVKVNLNDAGYEFDDKTVARIEAGDVQTDPKSPEMRMASRLLGIDDFARIELKQILSEDEAVIDEAELSERVESLIEELGVRDALVVAATSATKFPWEMFEEKKDQDFSSTEITPQMNLAERFVKGSKELEEKLKQRLDSDGQAIMWKLRWVGDTTQARIERCTYSMTDPSIEYPMLNDRVMIKKLIDGLGWDESVFDGLDEKSGKSLVLATAMALREVWGLDPSKMVFDNRGFVFAMNSGSVIPRQEAVLAGVVGAEKFVRGVLTESLGGDEAAEKRARAMTKKLGLRSFLVRQALGNGVDGNEFPWKEIDQLESKGTEMKADAGEVVADPLEELKVIGERVRSILGGMQAISEQANELSGLIDEQLPKMSRQMKETQARDMARTALALANEGKLGTLVLFEGANGAGHLELLLAKLGLVFDMWGIKDAEVRGKVEALLSNGVVIAKQMTGYEGEQVGLVLKVARKTMTQNDPGFAEKAEMLSGVLKTGKLPEVSGDEVTDPEVAKSAAQERLNAIKSQLRALAD